MSDNSNRGTWSDEDVQKRLNDIPYEQWLAEYQVEYVPLPPQMLRSSVNGDTVVDFPTTPSLQLVCERCGKSHGDNNALITDGPHAGARPTDLTVYCEVSGQQERVILRSAR